jgi:formyl-CoA transferase
MANQTAAALEGIKVLDLTRARAGPTAARQLADFGAEVIKIEMPGDSHYGDLGIRQGPDFQNLHRNKLGMTLNLKKPAGLAIFKRLVETADVVIENYRPQVKHRLGIDYDSLRELNPRLIYASISGFGQTGPYADRPGLDQIAQGMGGHMAATGDPDGGPVRSGTAISDLTAGLLAANGIMTALFERQKSGEGQWLHTSLIEAQIFLMDFQAARWLVDGEVPPQTGNDHPTNSPMGTFKTQDGFVNIAPMPAMWAKFCKAMELGPLQEHPDYATLEARVKNRAQLKAVITEITITKKTKEWVESLNQAGIPCGPIYKMDEVFADEQVKHLGIAQTVDSPVRGELSIIGQPVTLGRTPGKLTAPSPELGQHTEEILAAAGYSADEIKAFRAEKVI